MRCFFINNIRAAWRNILISGVLGDAEILTVQTRGDGLAVVLTTNVVILGHEVVMYLGEVGLLISVVGVAECGLPIVSEMLVTRDFLHAADKILPTIAVQYGELLVSELIVPLALDLLEGRRTDGCDTSTNAKLVEWLSSLSIAPQLHEGFSLDEQHLGVANLNTVDAILGDLEVLTVLVTLVYALTVDRCVDGRVIVIGLAISRIFDFHEIGLSQALVVGLLSLPIIIKIIVSHLGMVLGIAVAVLTVLEGEGP